jgi:AcrR family transcriptional regulator
MLKGSLYHYIRTKEDFLFGIIDEVQVRGLQLLEESRAIDGGPMERLHRFVHQYAVFTIDNRVKASVFDRDFRSLSSDRREALVRDRDRYDTFLRDILQDGVRSGAISDELDVAVAANVIFQMVNSVFHWYSPSGRRSTDEIAELLADFAVAGAAGAGRRQPEVPPARLTSPQGAAPA